MRIEIEFDTGWSVDSRSNGRMLASSEELGGTALWLDSVRPSEAVFCLILVNPFGPLGDAVQVCGEQVLFIDNVAELLRALHAYTAELHVVYIGSPMLFDRYMRSATQATSLFRVAAPGIAAPFIAARENADVIVTYASTHHSFELLGPVPAILKAFDALRNALQPQA